VVREKEGTQKRGGGGDREDAGAIATLNESLERGNKGKKGRMREQEAELISTEYLPYRDMRWLGHHPEGVTEGGKNEVFSEASCFSSRLFWIKKEVRDSLPSASRQPQSSKGKAARSPKSDEGGRGREIAEAPVFLQTKEVSEL